MAAAFVPYAAHAAPGVFVAALVLALVNAPAEEMLWRGTYNALFPGSLRLAYLYPTVFFGLWHFAPAVVMENPLPGGTWSFVGGATVVGALWGWLAWRTRSILLTTLSHLAANFFGFVGFIHLAW